MDSIAPINTQAFIKPSGNSAFKISYIIFGVLILVFSIGGFLIGKYLSPKTVSVKAPDNALFTSVTADIKGKIIKVEGDILTVQNEAGLHGNLKASDKIIITRLDKPAATPSANLNTIELNKEAEIHLVETGGQFEVVSINLVIMPVFENTDIGGTASGSAKTFTPPPVQPQPTTPAKIFQNALPPSK